MGSEAQVFLSDVQEQREPRWIRDLRGNLGLRTGTLCGRQPWTGAYWLRPMAIPDVRARESLRSRMGQTDGPRWFFCGVWTFDGRAERPYVLTAKKLLLVERAVMALCHHANAQGSSECFAAIEVPVERPIEISAGHFGGLCQAAGDLRQEPSKGWEALFGRSLAPRHRLVRGA